MTRPHKYYNFAGPLRPKSLAYYELNNKLRYTTHMIRIFLLMDIVMMRAVVTTINIIGYLKKKNTIQIWLFTKLNTSQH